jgi:hypothetical protein
LIRTARTSAHAQGAQAIAGDGCGVSEHLWSMEEIVALIDARAPKPGKRGRIKMQRSPSDFAILSSLRS